MFTLRKLTLALALTGLLSTPVLAETTVLASLPITFGLSELLLKDSGVKLQRAAPANLPGSRQSAYFSGRGAPALHTLATGADAVIGLRSLWSDDPLYPMARRSNIRIVEIDAARPVDGSLSSAGPIIHHPARARMILTPPPPHIPPRDRDTKQTSRYNQPRHH